MADVVSIDPRTGSTVEAPVLLDDGIAGSYGRTSSRLARLPGVETLAEGGAPDGTGSQVTPLLLSVSAHSQHTSVGTAAFRRFPRPVTWQGAPQEVLPEELTDGYEGIPRRSTASCACPVVERSPVPAAEADRAT